MKMSEVLRFKLNNDYRNPVSVDAVKSGFSGRDEELQKLKSLIMNRTAATAIIGGVRGVGKTSFVRECLRQIKSKSKDDLVVADISFADFNEKVESEHLRDKVLKSLIRALYFAFQEEDRSEDLKSLYDKTYYSELKETQLLELAKESENSNRETLTTERTYKITTSDSVVNIAKIVFVSLLGASGFWSLALFVKGGWLIAGIILLTVFAFIVLKFDFQSSKKKEVENSALNRASAKVGTSGIAAFDLSPDTLEIKLRQILCNSKQKVVFVIDELDKLSDSSDSLDKHAVFQIIKPLKNLFSLSNAIFLFIGADDFFDKLENESFTNPYSALHTIFTDRIFLTSMYHEDINKLIDSYRDGTPLIGDEITYKKFKNFISWKAKNHIFDTHNLLESYSTYSDPQGIFVSVKEDDQISKGNISNDWETAAGLQLYIAVTFENHKYPGINRLNEKLYLTLREVAQTIFDELEIKVTGNKYFNILTDDQQKRLKIENLSYEDRENFGGGIEDLLLRMERSGFANITEEQTVDANQKPLIVHTYELTYEDFPDESEIREKNKQLSFEVEFLKTFDELGIKKQNLEKNNLSSFNTCQKEYARLQKIAEPIRNEQKNRQPKSEILKLTERVDDIHEELRDVVFTEVVNAVSKEVGSQIISTGQNSLAQTMWDADTRLKKFYDHLHNEVNEEHYNILELNDKYVVVGLNFDVDLQDIYLGSNSHHYRKLAKTKIISVILDDDISNKPGQMKWTEVSGRHDFSDIGVVSKKLKEQVKKYFA